MNLGSWRWLILGMTVCSAVRIPLSKLPPSHSIATLSRFFIYGKPSSNTTEIIPSFGWGLWDTPYPLHSRLIASDMTFRMPTQAVALLDKNETNIDKMVWLTVMKSQDFWQQFIPYQNHSHFCCRAEDVESGECAAENMLRLPESIRANVMMAPVVSSLPGLRRNVTEAVFPFHETGAYYLMLVNCLPQKSLFLLEQMIGTNRPVPLEGTVYIESTHGFMSAIDVPKLHLYFFVATLTAILALWWMLMIMKAVDDEEDERFVRAATPTIRPHKVSFIHNYMSLTLCFQLLEALTSYIYYSWENNSSYGASFAVKIIASAASVLKHITVTTLVLALCLGVFSIIDVMPPYMKARVWLFTVAFAVVDVLKTLSLHFRDEVGLGPVALVLFSVPAIAVSVIGLVWAWASLNSTINKCREDRRRLMYKEVMLLKLRRIVLVSTAFFAFSAAAQIFEQLQDAENIWRYEWYFTDASPALLFLFVTFSVALIIRPSIQEYQAKKLAAMTNNAASPSLQENLQVDSVEIMSARRNEGGYKTFSP